MATVEEEAVLIVPSNDGEVILVTFINMWKHALLSEMYLRNNQNHFPGTDIH